MIFLVVFLVPIALFCFFVFLVAQKKKKYDAMYQKIAANPSDASVDALIDFHTRNICINEPNYWNRLRAVWLAINASPNVTTPKKEQLKSFLMLKWLNMHYKDAQIIDNYNK